MSAPMRRLASSLLQRCASKAASGEGLKIFDVSRASFLGVLGEPVH